MGRSPPRLYGVGTGAWNGVIFAPRDTPPHADSSALPVHTYALLLRHHWQSFYRHVVRPRWWLGFAVVPLLLYIAATLVGAGYFADRFLEFLSIDTTALALLNDYLLGLLVGLLGARFFFQRPPRLRMTPYLHLPLPRTSLVAYFQWSSLVSLHNILPLLFLVPFWLQHVRPVVPIGGAVVWGLGVLACLALSHLGTLAFRLLLDRRLRVAGALLILLAVTQIIDQWIGAGWTSVASAQLFNSLAAGNGLLLGILGVLIGSLALLTTQGLHSALRSSRHVQRRPSLWSRLVRFRSGLVHNLVVLELKMMLRTKRPKQYAYVSVVLAVLYTGLLLSDYNVIRGPLMDAFLGLFASGAFALNYGQLMFAWESRHFDGLLSRDLSPQQLVLAKLMVLQLSCLAMFLICLPFFWWLAPRLLTLHVAFLFYNVGVTSVLMLTLAVRNQKRVSTSEGHFFNYQGFSLWHWLWLLPTVAPPAALLVGFGSTPATAITLVAALGLFNMLLAWPWAHLLGRQLTQRRYIMAAGFRTAED